MRLYEEKRNDGEPFNDFVERVGDDEFVGAVKDLTLPVEFSIENMNQFIDWRVRTLTGWSAAKVSAQSESPSRPHHVHAVISPPPAHRPRQESSGPVAF